MPLKLDSVNKKHLYKMLGVALTIMIEMCNGWLAA
jgi:hypothetical protein